MHGVISRLPIQKNMVSIYSHRNKQPLEVVPIWEDSGDVSSLRPMLGTLPSRSADRRSKLYIYWTNTSVQTQRNKVI